MPGARLNANDLCILVNAGMKTCLDTSWTFLMCSFDLIHGPRSRIRRRNSGSERYWRMNSVLKMRPRSRLAR